MVEREEKEGREIEESGRGGEKLLSRAAFQFMLIRWPVQYASYMQMSRLHVPPIFRQLPAPLPPPSLSSLPWKHKSQSILHNAMRAWLNGGVAPAPLPTTLCIPHTKHAATFLASSRCVCICPTVRHNGDKGGTQNFLCCIYPVAAQQEEGRRGEVLPQTV